MEYLIRHPQIFFERARFPLLLAGRKPLVSMDHGIVLNGAVSAWIQNRAPVLPHETSDPQPGPLSLGKDRKSDRIGS